MDALPLTDDEIRELITETIIDRVNCLERTDFRYAIGDEAKMHGATEAVSKAVEARVFELLKSAEVSVTFSFEEA